MPLPLGPHGRTGGGHWPDIQRADAIWPSASGIQCPGIPLYRKNVQRAGGFCRSSGMARQHERQIAGGRAISAAVWQQFLSRLPGAVPYRILRDLAVGLDNLGGPRPVAAHWREGMYPVHPEGRGSPACIGRCQTDGAAKPNVIIAGASNPCASYHRSHRSRLQLGS